MVSDQSELTMWLEELEFEHARTALLIASIRQKLGLDPHSSSTQPPTATAAPARGVTNSERQQHLRADTFFGMTVPDAIKLYLSIAKRPQSPKAIGDALKQGGVLSQAADFYANVSTSLKRLTVAGDVVNTKEGWGLSIWYPNRKATDSSKAQPKNKVVGRSKLQETAGRRSATKTASPNASSPRPTEGPRKGPPKSGWHDFLANSLKEGKSMKAAAAEWKLRPEANE